MKEKILTNIRIIDPSQKMDEIGNIIIDGKGKIKSIGKNTKISDVSKSVEKKRRRTLYLLQVLPLMMVLLTSQAVVFIVLFLTQMVETELTLI